LNNLLPSVLLQSPEPSLYVNAITSKVRHSGLHGLGIGVVVLPGGGGGGGGGGVGGPEVVVVVVLVKGGGGCVGGGCVGGGGGGGVLPEGVVVEVVVDVVVDVVVVPSPEGVVVEVVVDVVPSPEGVVEVVEVEVKQIQLINTSASGQNGGGQHLQLHVQNPPVPVTGNGPLQEYATGLGVVGLGVVCFVVFTYNKY
jgi:hypothetical protein